MGRIIDKATAGNLNGYSFDVIKAKGGPHGKCEVEISLKFQGI